MRVAPGQIVTPPRGHDCPRPDQNELRVSTDPHFPASHYVHLVSPSVPPGSRWRCPECGGLWRVIDKNTRQRTVRFCGTFAWEWEQASSGFWWRVFHRTAVHQGPPEDGES